MRFMMLSILAATLAAIPAPAAADARSAFDQVIADAQRVREEAQDVKQLLRSRDAGQAVVLQRVSVLETHALALKASISQLDAGEAGLTSTQLAAVERARAASETLLILLQNKTALLADAGKLERQRGLLRAKAEGIVARARLVEQQMARARG
ncbi:MAG: hypothetical protein JNL48_06660 [Acidobacteria bacterium]|nr:hypothetical protein [Acidobacteriota bacterium]